MVPEDLRVKRSKAILAQSPEGQTWCAGCQSFRDLVDFAKGATKCRPCSSAKAHATRIEKTYGLTTDQYDLLLAAQGGRCAICRARPRSKRLAVDHDHKSGAVRGLLCSRCNHDLMGSAWDSLALVVALWHYLNTPPASGSWLPPEDAPAVGILESAQRPSDEAGGLPLVTAHGARKKPGAANVAADATECARPHVLPVGAISVPGKRGVWKVYVDDSADGDAPF